MGYSNEMVAHIWAQQGDKREAASNNGNFYFRGNRIYSYGSHYVAGMIDDKGRAWLNSRGYSQTTAGKHLPAVRAAVSHRTRLYVPDLTPIVDAIEGRRKVALRDYLAKMAGKLSPETGAAIYALFSRGDYAKLEARNLAKAAKLAARNASRLKAHNRREAARIASRLKAWRSDCLATIEGYGTHRIDGLISDTRDAHLAAGSPRIKAAVWQRLKLARAIRADADKYRGRLDLRKAIAALRHQNAGGNATAIETGLGRSALWHGLAHIFRAPQAGHMLPATRARLVELERACAGIGAQLVEREKAAENRRIARRELGRQIRQWRGIMKSAREYTPDSGWRLDADATWQFIGHAARVVATAPGITPAGRDYLRGVESFAGGLIDQLKAKREADEERRRNMTRAEKVAAWRAGESFSGNELYSFATDERGGAIIRAKAVELDGCKVIGGTLETSQGATVPLRHAAAVFAFVRAKRESAPPVSVPASYAVWQRGNSGPRAGHFAIDRVYANGDFVAGCHRINWEQTESLARELGIWACDDSALIEGGAE